MCYAAYIFVCRESQQPHNVSLSLSLSLTCGAYNCNYFSPPLVYSDASSETRFKLKAMSSFSHSQSLKPGAFKLGSKLAPPPPPWVCTSRVN